MKQKDCITTKKKYKHLNQADRYKLEGFIKAKKTVKEIAELLDKHVSTIYREIPRGSVLRYKSDLSEKIEYRANVAQENYKELGKNKERSLKIGKDRKFEEYVRKMLLEKEYSPDAIIAQAKKDDLQFEGMVCTKTLYNYIDAGIFAGISNENLWEKRERNKQRKKKIARRVSLNNTMARSITERPKEANDRSEYGHWEGDCVKGKQGTTAALLTLTERKTLEQIIIKLKNATQKEVRKVFDRLERKHCEEFSLKFLTITFDNGVEFLDWESLEVSIFDTTKKRLTTYFAHAYSAWERGSNENSNKIIRRFVKKGTDISEYSYSEIKRIEKWMNNYPRKKLGYKTAAEAVKECLQNSSDQKLGNVAL